jgi:hypothetical protein
MTNTYTTPELVQAELRQDEAFASFTTPTVDTVNEWIKESSEYINQISGRVYGLNTYTEILDYNGEDKLYLQNAPVNTVTSVLYATAPLGSDSYSLSDTKVLNKDYTIYNDEGLIALLPSWSPAVGRKRIQVTYTAGLASTDTPKTVQMLATKLVTKRVIDSVIGKDINQKQSGKSVSVGSISIVKPADFGVSQYNLLKQEIADLQNSIINGTTAYRVKRHRY